MSNIKAKPVGQQSKDLTPLKQAAIKAALIRMTGLIDSHFDKRQNTWQKLAPFTISERKSRGYGAGPILIQTRNLRLGAVEGEPEIAGDGNSGEIGTDVEYAAEMEFGVSSRRVPARPFYLIDDESELLEIDDAINEAVEDWWGR